MKTIWQGSSRIHCFGVYKYLQLKGLHPQMLYDSHAHMVQLPEIELEEGVKLLAEDNIT